MHPSLTRPLLSTAPARTASAPPAPADGAASPGDLACALAIGRAADHFDTALYGLAAVLVWPALFFGGLSARDGLLAGLALLALGLAVRPLGTLCGMALQARHGRSVPQAAAALVLGAASCLTALLPGSADAGMLAVLLLVACRLVQGLAAGARWDSAPSLLAMQVPAAQRARFTALAHLGAPAGLALAAGLVAGLQSALDSAEWLAWGWRFPFVVALALHAVALVARLQLVQGDDHADHLRRSELDHTDLADLLHAPQAAGLREIARATGLMAAAAAVAVLATLGVLAWSVLQSPAHIGALLGTLVAAAALAAVCMPLSGRLTDALGARSALRVLVAGALGLALVSPWLLGGGLSGQRMLMGLGGALAGLLLGVAGPLAADAFPAPRRHLGAALATDAVLLASLGLAPLALLALAGPLGAAALGLVLAVAGVLTLWALRATAQALHAMPTLPDSLAWLKLDPQAWTSAR